MKVHMCMAEEDKGKGPEVAVEGKGKGRGPEVTKEDSTEGPKKPKKMRTKIQK